MPGLLENADRLIARQVMGARGIVDYRHGNFGQSISHVLLHGIGSGATSWPPQLMLADSANRCAAGIGRSERVAVAWNAPGYGNSAPLAADSPSADDYGAAVWAWLDALDCHAPVTLVGQSLGCIMAAAAARAQPTRVTKLVLLAPARGYATAPAAQRETIVSDRIGSLAKLGASALADARAAALLSANASDEMRSLVHRNMAALNLHGYGQAVRMLVGSSIDEILAAVQCKIVVASGRADTITPQASCQSIADTCGATFMDLGDVGHACAIEAGERVNTLLGLEAPRHLVTDH